MKIINKWQCAKCGKKAQPGVLIMNIYGMWLCGDCYMEYRNKLNEQRKREILG